MSRIDRNASSNDAMYRRSGSRRSGPKGRAGLVVAVLIVLAAGAAMAWSGFLRPIARAAAAARAPTFYEHLGDLHLLDQDGRMFEPATLAGRIVLLNFVFTGCAASCPTQTRELAALQHDLPASLRHEVRFVSISVDPLGDTPALLRAYGHSAGADFSSWTFATGRPQDIERLSARLGLFSGGATPARPEDHTTSLWLIDGHGRRMQRYAGGDIARLADEFAQLRRLEAGSG